MTSITISFFLEDFGVAAASAFGSAFNFAFAFKVPQLQSMDHAVIMSLSGLTAQPDALKRRNNRIQLFTCTKHLCESGNAGRRRNVCPPSRAVRAAAI
jgi:hypothetical protein